MSEGNHCVYSHTEGQIFYVGSGDANHVASLMKNLEPREMSILLAFSDGVEVEDIASENNMTALDALVIRSRAIEKIRSLLKANV